MRLCLLERLARILYAHLIKIKEFLRLSCISQSSFKEIRVYIKERIRFSRLVEKNEMDESAYAFFSNLSVRLQPKLGNQYNGF